MKISRVLLLVGFLLYVGSFFLLAVAPAGEASNSGVRGYICAAITLITPFSSDGWRLLQASPLQYFALLISGLVNPVFLITFIALLIRPNGRLAGILRFFLPVMFVFCWVIFHYQHLTPRSGHFLWMGSILLAAFSTLFVRADRTRSAMAG